MKPAFLFFKNQLQKIRKINNWIAMFVGEKYIFVQVFLNLDLITIMAYHCLAFKNIGVSLQK
jgi:hypothetical protein